MELGLWEKRILPPLCSRRYRSEIMSSKHHNVLTVGFIGRCLVEDLPQIKNEIEEITGLRIVFFKVVSGRLWLKVSDSQ